MIKILFAAADNRWEEYKGVLPIKLSAVGIKADLSRNHAPEDTDYIVYAPNPKLTDFTPFTKTKAVLSLWAGVETIVTNKTLTQPLTRMVDGGLTEGMVEWVVGHTLRHHLGMDTHIVNPKQAWTPKAPPLARNRTVGILGLGELGASCASALAALNFNVVGWSRTQKSDAPFACYAGAEGLKTVLGQADIIVTLMPNTPATENIINADTLAATKDGAAIINPGRGELIDDEALISALENGKLSGATLDVFRIEPLPKDHAYWSLPNVLITPHVASETRVATASAVVVENIARVERGEQAKYLVDPALKY